MQQSQVKHTYSDYLLLDDDARRELIEGEFYVVPAPNTRHQRTSMKLGKSLDDYVENNALGEVFAAPTDVVLSEEDVVQPDILFVSAERSEIITPDNIRGAPDLVVEILSPSTANRDRQEKSDLYARYGVGEYWIVDPEEESVRVFELGSQGYRPVDTYTTGKAHSAVVEGFAVELSRIFAG